MFHAMMFENSFRCLKEKAFGCFLEFAVQYIPDEHRLPMVQAGYVSITWYFCPQAWA